MSLILDKITPPAEMPRLSRARLLADLTGSLSCSNSTFIHGRTGAGKTLLAADFAARAGRRVAWYKVDSAESELQLFIQYLVAAVRVQHPGFGRKTLALAAAGALAGEGAGAPAGAVVYEMTRPASG